ncbi:response regulator [Rhizobium panacihumi]|uniref:response regulator n=1 Tax=Rhizobium panacihumi TaxID=2008450 RepID=UPI003D7AA2D9
MRILIIDDEKSKRSRVAELVGEGLKDYSVQIKEAATYEQALLTLQESYYDVVILDLLLPAADGTPSQDSSRSIIRQVTNGTGLIPPMHIIGLTAYETVADQERAYFDQHLLSLEFYSAQHNQWADKIVSKIIYLMQSQNASMRFQAENFGVDVFVIAARHENEFLPIRKKLFKNWKDEVHPLWKGQITTGEIEMRDGRVLTAILCCVNEMGMAPTAAVASQAINVFRPKLLAMIGMCCGFNTKPCVSERKIMDVIVAREVTCWEEGKYVDRAKEHIDFQNRAKTRVVNELIRDDVEKIIEQSERTITPALMRMSKQTFYKKVRDHFNADAEEALVRDIPDVKYAAIVSGSSVIADESTVQQILARHTNAIGLDMELFGLYTAVDKVSGKRPSVVGVKGVADFGKASKDDKAQEAASTVATEVFKCIVENLEIFKNAAAS